MTSYFKPATICYLDCFSSLSWPSTLQSVLSIATQSSLLKHKLGHVIPLLKYLMIPIAFRVRPKPFNLAHKIPCVLMLPASQISSCGMLPLVHMFTGLLSIPQM